MWGHECKTEGGKCPSEGISDKCRQVQGKTQSGQLYKWIPKKETIWGIMAEALVDVD